MSQCNFSSCMCLISCFVSICRRASTDSDDVRRTMEDGDILVMLSPAKETRRGQVVRSLGLTTTGIEQTLWAELKNICDRTMYALRATANVRGVFVTAVDDHKQVSVAGCCDESLKNLSGNMRRSCSMCARLFLASTQGSIVLCVNDCKHSLLFSNNPLGTFRVHSLPLDVAHEATDPSTCASIAMYMYSEVFSERSWVYWRANCLLFCRPHRYRVCVDTRTAHIMDRYRNECHGCSS